MNLIVAYTVMAFALGLVLFIMSSNRTQALKKDGKIKNELLHGKQKEADVTDLAN
jgi:hypothetical protein